jgi:HAD superfamily hydrolase (TIGR01509 family)
MSVQPPPALVIFDCDGVLIDSEIVVCRLVAEEMTRLGFPHTTHDVIERYAGRPEREMIADIERRTGRQVPPDYFARIKPLVAEAYADELAPISGAREVLETLAVPHCVASSSDPAKLRLGLETVGLLPLVAANLVSAAWVHQGKPAPDVFVYAAGWMRTPVSACLVIEDSLAGVRAGRAAGMRVVGFTGGRHCGPEHGRRLLDAGAEAVVTDLRHVLDYQGPGAGPIAAALASRPG